MRGVPTSVLISIILLAFLVTFTTTAYCWTVTVNNATTCKIRVKIEYGALGRLIKEDYIDPNGTKTFGTGADCPLKLHAAHQERDSKGICNGSYTINTERCFMQHNLWKYCIHACWDTMWKIVGTTSDKEDMQRNP